MYKLLSFTLLGTLLTFSAPALAQQSKPQTLRKFIIEREIPKVGSLGPGELKGAAAKSNDALAKIGTDIQWVESYVTADKTFCVYLAKDDATIRKHAEISGFPASKITEIRKTIDPTTANE